MTGGPLPDGQVPSAELWAELNRRIVAKTLSELAFEEAFAPEASDAAGTRWVVRLGQGITYRFGARKRIWGNLAIDPASVLRDDGIVVAPAADAAQLMRDLQQDLQIEPDTLATYVKELTSTLVADARIAAISAAMDADALLALPDGRLQQYLDGHPKAPASKGRIGWGLRDFEAYAPEFQAEIRLFWIAARRTACRFAHDPDIGEDALIAASLDPAERQRLDAACHAVGVDRAHYLLMPVHPWQWANAIVSQFAGEIAARRIVPLGTFGAPYLAQQSLRTLANGQDPTALNVKLALTILNTSAWRGVPGKYIAIGPMFSTWLAGIAAGDPELQRAVVLREIAGAFYPHPHYEAIDGAPYQYKEMLGAIWREPAEARLPPGERPMMLGALLKQDRDGRPLVSTLIARSGLTHDAWLERLFDSVVVPLYHFLACYGVGFIAHSQNVTLVLAGDIPCGVALKDLQGDVDLVDQAFPEAADLPDAVRQVLLKRPPLHLLQHLQTGHFASVLRFLSDALASSDGLSEMAFYAALVRSLARYRARHPELQDRFALFDLMAPQVPRICINRVRLAVGYGDANRRPVPSLGTDLVNPLHLAALNARSAAPTPAGVHAS